MLQVGDLVYDIEADDPDPMRVLDTRIGVAHEVNITELCKTVHEVNPSYSPEDQVIETVYETWLDSHVPDWTDWPLQELDEKLENFTAEWSISIQSYYYPESRLKVVDEVK